jgi:hypothetical protein
MGEPFLGEATLVKFDLASLLDKENIVFLGN